MHDVEINKFVPICLSGETTAAVRDDVTLPSNEHTVNSLSLPLLLKMKLKY